MSTFSVRLGKSIIEFHGFSSMYIRIGTFERFWGDDGAASL